MRRIGHTVLLALGLALAPLVVGLGALAEEEPRIDPQSLVGEWVGSFAVSHKAGAAGAEGRYFLTIRRVVEPRVFGHVEMSGHRHLEFDVVGTLNGSRLTYGRVELTIYDRGALMEMRGSTSAAGPSAEPIPLEITLHKKKQ